MIPVGYGLPVWLPTDLYLSAPETRALPLQRHSNGGTCLICGEPPCGPTFQLEGAHVAQKGAGGTKKAGPTAETCYRCHHEKLHGHGDATLAIRRADLVPVFLELVDGEVIERSLKW